MKKIHTVRGVVRPKKRKPIVALVYDFDGTLAPGNMQEYDFLKAIGIKGKKGKMKFWKENSELSKAEHASEVLCYMKLMLEKAAANHKSVQRADFKSYGIHIPLYKGVKQWFKMINRFGKKYGVIIRHYINSSGLKEIIEGTKICSEFEQIYASSYMYDENGTAVWPAVAVDFTTKTQFLFMINKGIESIDDNKRVNKFMPEEKREVPFDHMIYFGDGDTDIPCMKLVKQKGGNSIVVYQSRMRKKKNTAMGLVADNRVNFACVADYSKSSEIYKIVEAIIKQIKSTYDFRVLQEKNIRKISIHCSKHKIN